MTDCLVNLAKIEQAARVIDEIFLHSPQYEDPTLNAVLRRRLLVKIETVNPIRSFKGRGADFLIRSLSDNRKIVCASAGNFGQAVAYAARKRGIAVEVFAAEDVNPVKAERMRALAARVTLAGTNFDEAKQKARHYALEHADYVFVEDGAEDAVTEGAGTIGMELLKAGVIDTVVIPVGDGALINGTAAWIKERSPQTRIVGVCAKGSPAMFESWREGRPVSGHSDTIADGIAVTMPIAKSVAQMKSMVDDIVLVPDESLIAAMRLAVSSLGVVLEPSGAAGLAAIQVHNLPGERLATILTGGNIHPEMFDMIMSKGSK